jgi:hypothetical protein
MKIPLVEISWPKWAWIVFKVYGWLICLAFKMRLVDTKQVKKSFDFVSNFIIKKYRFNLRHG